MTATDVWSLPGPARLVERVRTELIVGKQVVLVLPTSGVADGVVAALARMLSELRQIEVLRFGEEEHARADSLLYDLLSRNRVPLPEDGSPPSARHLLTDFYRSSGLTLIVDLTKAHPDDLGKWGRNLARHAAHMKSLRDSERVGLIVACRADQLDLVPSEDVNVTRHWWWGILGRLDVLLWSLDRRPEGPDGEVTANAIVELGAFDLKLTDHLLAVWDGDLGTAHETLRVYGRTSGIMDGPEGLREHTVLDSGRTTPRGEVPRPLRSAWNAGLVQLWEGAVSWHRSALAELAPARPDADRELKRLVWRAQVATLLPNVEFARHAIARSVAEERDQLREDSKFRATCRSSKDVEMLEYTDLRDYLRDLRGNARRPDLEQVLDRLRFFRNRLAHVDPLRANRVRELISVIEKARAAAR